jgi:hypothetical protein
VIKKRRGSDDSSFLSATITSTDLNQQSSKRKKPSEPHKTIASLAKQNPENQKQIEIHLEDKTGTTTKKKNIKMIAPSHSYYDPGVRSYYPSPNDPYSYEEPGEIMMDRMPPPVVINPEHEYISAIASGYDAYPTHDNYISRRMRNQILRLLNLLT